MRTTLREGYQFIRTNDASTIWRAFNRRDSHPLLQFLKYGLCGGLAVIVHNGVFAGLGYTLLPAFHGMLVDGEMITLAERRPNFIYCSVLGFLASNGVAYLTNLAWVFEGGKHHRLLEFFFFTSVSSIGFVVGMTLALVQMRQENSSSWLASIVLLITATMVNFVCRKFFIFQR